MKITYFKDTDTLLVNFNDNEIAHTRDLNENVLVELVVKSWDIPNKETCT